ncbi:MAG: allantoicase [Acidimicrobiia bacterium]
MSSFTDLVDLASESLGGAVLAANDEFFAPKENLLKPASPIFIEDRYTDRGKWMDGWETRRRRQPGHDWCLVRLGLAGVVRSVIVDTTHFIGNYPAACSLEACTMSGRPGPAELTHPSTIWTEILPRARLEGDTPNHLVVESPYRFTHLRFNIYPDGGVARLRVHGEVIPDWPAVAAEQLDLAGLENGGAIVDCSDRFFGHPGRLLAPGPPASMRDGWETRRRRGPGHDWVVIQLGAPGAIHGAEVDTTHFKGNAPGSCSLEVADSTKGPWRELLPESALEPDARHTWDEELKPAGPAAYARLNIYPDGGVARLRLWGMVDEGARPGLGVRWLDSLPPEAAARELLSCCGSVRWSDEMARARPYSDPAGLLESADRTWEKLRPEDWEEAFRAHPAIGEQGEDRWSSREQAGSAAASRETLSELAAANRSYRERFGRTFIVFATGKTAEEMLAIVKGRLDNPPEQELREAAAEQRNITRQRLEKLIAPSPDRPSQGVGGK